MSDEENPRAPSAEAIPVRTEHALATRPVRMSLRPPARFTAGADFKLWLTRFEMYVQQAGLSETQRVKELLSLLEDEPFRVVSQHGLLEIDDFHAVTECLRQHYAPGGNELEWQFKLQTRTQKPGEQLADFAGALRMLADKAYPKWSAEQRQEILKSQFIQGIRSSSIQLWLMRDIPGTLEETLRIASQQETVEMAQKRLHKEKHLTAETLALEIDAEKLQPEAATQVSANAIRRSRPSEIEELTTQVRQLSQEVAQLRGEQAGRQRGPVCWGCRERGHLRRNCPKQRRPGKQQGGKWPLN